MWNDVVLADSDDVVVVEGNTYFPPDAVRWPYLERTDHHTVCPWKGRATFFAVRAGGGLLENGAWQYPEPTRAGAQIRDRVAFDRAVALED